MPVVPSRARADRQPGSWCRVVPALATAAVVPVVPVVSIDNREGGADHRPSLRGPALLPMIDGGKLVPVVPAVPIDSRERRADHPGPRLATAAVVPSRAGRADRRREAVADHPGPRVATAAVLLPMIDAGKVVPRLDSREAGARGARADRRRERRADHPGPRVATAAVLLPMIDGGKLLPIIQGHAGNVVPRLDSREAGARGARADRRREGGADHRRREGGADHRRREGGAAPRQPGSWCRSSRATARNGRRRARGAESCRPCRSSTLPRSCPTAGSWCPSCRPCRSTAGNVVPIIQGHGLQRPRWCPWCRVVPAVSIDNREGGADHRPGCAVLPCCR